MAEIVDATDWQKHTSGLLSIVERQWAEDRILEERAGAR
jgi:hypothetical protein